MTQHPITEPGYRPRKLLGFNAGKFWQHAKCEFEDGTSDKAVCLTLFVGKHARKPETMLAAMPPEDVERIKAYVAANEGAIRNVARRLSRSRHRARPVEYFVTNLTKYEGKDCRYIVTGPLASRFQMIKALRRAKKTMPNAKGGWGRAV